MAQACAVYVVDREYPDHMWSIRTLYRIDLPDVLPSGCFVACSENARATSRLADEQKYGRHAIGPPPLMKNVLIRVIDDQAERVAGADFSRLVKSLFSAVT